MLSVLHRCRRVAPALVRAQWADWASASAAASPCGQGRRPSWLRTDVPSRRAQSREQRLYTHTGAGSSVSDSSGDAFQKESHVTDSVSSQSSSLAFSLDVLVSLLRQENAVDVCVIKIPANIQYAGYLVVVSGISTRHIHAMALYAIKVYKYLKTKKEPNVKIEGKDSEDWMCIDFGNIVVHLMLPETRELYELEKLWTLRGYDEQLMKIPPETLPEDFIFDNLEVTK